MRVNDLLNLLNRHGSTEMVTVDETGLKIGYDGHVDVPRSDGRIPYRFTVSNNTRTANDVT